MTVLKEYNTTTGTWEPIFAGTKGEGVPTGGAVGTSLVKKSAADYDTMWQAKPTFDARDFGVKADGTTQNTAIQAAIAAVSATGGTLRFGPGTYRITTTMQITASNVAIELDPAAIIDATAVSPHDRPAFRWLGSFATLTGVHLAADAPVDSETITMASVAGVSVGDVLGMWSTDIWTDERTGYCHSEYITVAGIAGNVITLDRPLRDSYTVATTKDFTKYSMLHNCTWSGGTIWFDAASFDNSGTRSGLALFCVDNFRISDLTVNTAEWGGIDLRHVRFGTVDNCYLYNCGNQQGDTGYGISISGEMVSVNGGQSKKCRHGVDVNGGFSVPISRDVSINGFIATENYAAGVGTHAGCESVIFNDCQVTGGNSGISIRGRKVSVLGGYYETYEIASHAPNYGRGLNVGDDFITWNGGNGPGGTDLTVIGATFRRLSKAGTTSADDSIYCSCPLVRAYFANNHFLGFTGHGAVFQGNYNTSATFVGNVWDGANQLAGKNGIYFSPHSTTGGLGTSTDIVVDGDKFYNIRNTAFNLRPPAAPAAPSARITINSPYVQAAEFVHFGLSAGEHISDVRISGRVAGGITSLAQVLTMTATNDGRITVEGISFADGSVSHGGAKLGFYGTTPIAKPSGVTARAALQSLGLGASLVADSSSATFNVMDYGASGNNSTNDKPAFDAAIAAAPAGSVIDLGGKSYYLGGTVSIAKTLTIQNGSVRAGNTPALTVTAADCTLWNLNVTRAVTAAGDGAIAAGVAVGVSGLRTQILNCRFTDATNYCVYFYNGLGNYSLVQGCDFTNSSARQSSGFICAADGPAANTGIVVRDCNGIGTGCSLGFMFLDSTDCLISGCTVKTMRRLPTVTMTGWTGVSGNIYKTADRIDGHTRVLYNNGVLVTENTATPTAPASNQWGFSGTDLYLNLAGTNPTSRTITSDIVSGYGITIYGDDNVPMCRNIISDCDISDTDGFGIYLQLAYATSVDNTIANCRLTDVCLTGDQAGNLPFAGIGVTGSTNTVISNTTIRNVGTVAKPIGGIKIMPGGLSTTSKGRIIGCTVTGANGYGIETLGGGCDWTFVDTHALACQTGFRHSTTSAADTAVIKLFGCSANESTLNHGVSFAPVAGSDFRAMVDGCTFYNNASRGLSMSNVASVLITGCKFRNNATNGINMSTTAAATVLNNHFEHTTAANLQVSAVTSLTQMAFIGNVATNGGTFSVAATTLFADANAPQLPGTQPWIQWTGTQVQYDAIATKDPNTLYAISG